MNLVVYFSLSCCFSSLCVGSLKWGVEAISTDVYELLKKNRVGLVANQTSIDQNARRTLDVLVHNGVQVARVFAPEHGFEGTVPAGKSVVDNVDAVSGITVTSLYAPDGRKQPNEAHLCDVDILVFDLQDVGMRHYTYISTLLCVLKAAVTYKKTVVVLDRPNPLGGVVEGPVVDPAFISFISIAPIPLRYGVTVGELARYFNERILACPANLRVVPMQGYQRGPVIVPFKNPLSPNIRSLDAVKGYSFLGLLGEILPFDIGVDTPHAFSCFGISRPISDAKKIDWEKLQRLLLHHHIVSSCINYDNPLHKGACRGMCISIENIVSVPSFMVLVDLIQFFMNSGVPISFLPAFDKAVGTDKVRLYLQGILSKDELAHHINQGLDNFMSQICPLLLYGNRCLRVHRW